MPELTRFFGIVVRMYFSDHSPAHFHAEYGEYEALIEIETLSVLRGDLPRRDPRYHQGEISRGGLWRWYSNGQPFIARN